MASCRILLKFFSNANLYKNNVFNLIQMQCMLPFCCGMLGMFQTTVDMIQFVGTRFPCSTLTDQNNRCRSCGRQITLGK